MTTDPIAPEAPAKKRTKPAPLGQFTRDLFEGLGFTVGKVEHFNTFTHRSNDLFGFADYLAIKPGVGIIALQVCALSALAAHRTKILDEPRARTWLEAGGRIEIVTWTKRSVPIMGKWWSERRTEITLADFA